MKRAHTLAIFSLGGLSLLMLAGCGGGSDAGLIGKYPYKQFYDPNTGCTTPPAHYVANIDAYCQTLANDRMNMDPRTGQVCAEAERRQNFQQNCSAYTWPNN